jgi:hypothetical protein
MTYAPLDRLPQPDRIATTIADVVARYVAVTVVGWRPGDAELVELAVM